MLMGWGPFRFTVPNYSVEDLQRRVAARAPSQPIIGRRPSIHRLGPDEETITLESTFHPHHMNRGGLGQLRGVEVAVRALTPHLLVHVSGLVFGRWTGREVSNRQTAFDPAGIPQTVTVTLTLVYDSEFGL